MLTGLLDTARCTFPASVFEGVCWYGGCHDTARHHGTDFQDFSQFLSHDLNFNGKSISFSYGEARLFPGLMIVLLAGQPVLVAELGKCKAREVEVRCKGTKLRLGGHWGWEIPN